VVVTLPENTFHEACHLLARWGRVRRTRHFNVLAMTVRDPSIFFNEFDAAVHKTPGLLNFVSHVIPAQSTFDFDTVDEFEAHARDVVCGWTTRLAGKTFHVRMHRRGFKGTLSTPHEERFLDEAAIAVLAAAGTPGRIGFDDPDAVIQVETIDARAGISLWTRDELQHCHFLGPG
jgi:hypothetical protein